MDDNLKQALTIGREYYLNKEYTKAEPYLAQVAREGKNFADVYNMLGVIYHDQGQFSRAQQSFEQALRINPRYTEAALNLAVTYNDLGKYQEAKETYRKALSMGAEAQGELDPFVKGKVANMYADIGDVYVSCGAFRQAVAEYERALALRPTFMDIRLKLAGAYRDVGDKQEAIHQLRTILQQNPQHIPARINLGIALYSAGDSDAAVSELEGVLQKEPGHARATLYLRMIQDRQRANAAGPDGSKPGDGNA
ncbi:MAG: tetratricopeptide repeat protein [Deltaproteobacteria bacterium]|nr:tetratricopeptide repeat protein [Deltaproteobacteria bacterium]